MTATFRTPAGAWRSFPMYKDLSPDRLLGGVDAGDLHSVVRAVAAAQPQVVVNCIGIVKQLEEAKDPVLTLTINALFPHRLADLCAAAGARLIHVSTDCVFSGRKGRYTEDDLPDAEDLYGRSKFLGEVDRPGCLTIRTSIIGRDFLKQTALLEWFLAQRGGTVRGYRNAIFSGLTTQALARVMGERDRPTSRPARRRAGRERADHQVRPARADPRGAATRGDHRAVRRPALRPQPRRERASWRRPATRIPTWDEMVAELAADPTPYDEWRRRHAAA